MTSRYPLAFPSDEASSWRRIRKYAVPLPMIEQATERRLAGDWRGACAAARVDVDFDLTGLAQQHGAETAASLEEDLWHFAPDLLRWHLPRWLRGRTTQRPNQCVILGGGDGRYLYATTSAMIDGPQRLTLSFGAINSKQYSWKHSQVQDWRFARHLWDARHADELLRHCGGIRAPFRNVDGTPRTADQLPTRDPGTGDPVGHTEWITLLYDRGNIAEAFAASGITLDDTPPQARFYSPPPLLDVLTRNPLALTRLEAVVRRLAKAGLGDHFLVRIQNRGDRLAPLLLKPNTGTPGLTLRVGQWDSLDGMYPIPEASWRRLPDLDLLRFGDIAPDELHPLIGASLFPERPSQRTDGPLGPAVQPSAPVRVRCRGGWHWVQSRNGRLDIPHTEEEERRERAIRAFGGPVTGCFAAQQAWTSGAGRLPKALREQREELFARIQHGDTAEVLRLLDAGVDPHLRDGRQRTLLHVLHLLDHKLMLARLLGAGLDLEAQDHHQRTPLHVAVGEGSVSLVHALLDAGARTDAVDHQDRSLASVIIQHKRKELRFLRDAVLRDHPHLITRYPTWGDLDD
ncbi:MAG TPA: ankyrin repeat domain-containing protein [Trebonia sp.]|nr:ankyrin repeat domain-containing protein [Trebonia sp.]